MQKCKNLGFTPWKTSWWLMLHLLRDWQGWTMVMTIIPYVTTKHQCKASSLLSCNIQNMASFTSRPIGLSDIPITKLYPPVISTDTWCSNSVLHNSPNLQSSRSTWHQFTRNPNPKRHDWAFYEHLTNQTSNAMGGCLDRWQNNQQMWPETFSTTTKNAQFLQTNVSFMKA